METPAVIPQNMKLGKSAFGFFVLRSKIETRWKSPRMASPRELGTQSKPNRKQEYPGSRGKDFENLGE